MHSTVRAMPSRALVSFLERGQPKRACKASSGLPVVLRKMPLVSLIMIAHRAASEVSRDILSLRKGSGRSEGPSNQRRCRAISVV